MTKILRRNNFLFKLIRTIKGKFDDIYGAHRIKRAIKSKKPLKIVIGSSDIYEENWIPTDIGYLNLLDKNHWERFFKRRKIDAIHAEHVWEHLTMEEGLVAAKNCFQFLKQGGYLRVAVPDGFHPDKRYIDMVKIGGTGAGAQDHKVLYNHQTFSELFTKAGFKVDKLEYFDKDGKFHFKEWDPEMGLIRRSKRFDPRNKEESLNYTSIIIDAIKD